ncbi:hypothetical protein D8B29_11645 [Verminephrobacter eiseniae]|nr:hypothetical protein [Verminephrobacter eiseniae]MCW5302945.1 hypothetical protein [Verminephrobacter eiseniae]MCW8180237.1 hypothetical protein [Verminephrobacter eiseniae]MCW8191571.1 hypothetical protein [Verminephrobacter eiseniae]
MTKHGAAGNAKAKALAPIARMRPAAWRGQSSSPGKVSSNARRFIRQTLLSPALPNHEFLSLEPP